MGVADCVYCGKTIDGDSAAVGLHGNPERAVYIPFVDDLRSSAYRLSRPTCYADHHGVQTLVDVIHEHDRLEHRRAMA